MYKILSNKYLLPIMILVVLFAAIIPSFALSFMQPKEYLLLKKQLSTKLSVEALKQNPANYPGKYFEVRGTYSGYVTGQDSGSLSISDGSGSSWVITSKEVPEYSPGTPVACLVEILPGSSVSLSDLALIAWTHGGSLTQLEIQMAPKPKPVVIPIKQNNSQVKKPYNQITAEEFVKIYKNAIKGFNGRLSEKEADTIARSILVFSHRYNVDPRLVCAVILAESHFRMDATSHSGAQGLGQLMPGTAAGMGIRNSYDPVQNVYGSARYIRSMLERVSGKSDWQTLTWDDLSLGLAAYNAGVGAVKRHGGIPPFRETQNYVRRVTAIYKQLCGI